MLITNSQRSAKRWKERIWTQLESKLKLALSPDKTIITNARKAPIHFLGFRYKQRSGKSRTGYITCTRPDDKRLKAKVESLHNDIRQLRKLEGQKLVHSINAVNSRIVGVGNYYRPATMVNVELRQTLQQVGLGHLTSTFVVVAEEWTAQATRCLSLALVLLHRPDLVVTDCSQVNGRMLRDWLPGTAVVSAGEEVDFNACDRVVQPDAAR